MREQIESHAKCVRLDISVVDDNYSLTHYNIVTFTYVLTYLLLNRSFNYCSLTTFSVTGALNLQVMDFGRKGD